MTLWNVEFTDQFEEWWETLRGDEQRALTAAVQLLERDGPPWGRPLADTIKGSRHRNMKELRPPATALRVLFGLRPSADRHPPDRGQQAAPLAGVVRGVHPGGRQSV
jgi:hypothetical protein